MNRLARAYIKASEVYVRPEWFEAKSTLCTVSHHPLYKCIRYSIEEQATLGYRCAPQVLSHHIGTARLAAITAQQPDMDS